MALRNKPSSMLSTSPFAFGYRNAGQESAVTIKSGWPSRIWVRTLQEETGGLVMSMEVMAIPAHLGSSQLYSMGHKSRPVSSFSNPRSSLEVGWSGLMSGVPSIPDIQLTTAGFRLAASSPLAPPAPFLSYGIISNAGCGKRIIYIAKIGVQL